MIIRAAVDCLIDEAKTLPTEKYTGEFKSSHWVGIQGINVHFYGHFKDGILHDLEVKGYRPGSSDPEFRFKIKNVKPTT